MFSDKQNRIWLKEYSQDDRTRPIIAYFRRKIILDEAVTDCQIKISADTRYKLYVNGHFIQAGPEKGDLEDWHFDRANIKKYFTKGENIIAVEVLRFPAVTMRRNHSLFIGPNPFLMVEGTLKTSKEQIDLSTLHDWKVTKACGRNLELEPFIPAPIHGLENVKADAKLTGWKNPGYNDDIFEEPKALVEADFIEAPGQRYLKERTIPYQRIETKNFKDIVCIRECTVDETEIFSQAKALIAAKGSMKIKANTKLVLEIDAGELMTAYPLLKIIGGKNAKIIIHCAESYGHKISENGQPHAQLKDVRTDYKTGTLNGVDHTFYPAGNGTQERPEDFETFWFATFRFVSLTIITADEPLELTSFNYTQTGYPLDVKTKATASDKDFKDIWAICERTLRRCMHETYMDCPFYEQLSYAMDSRAQILYTYSIAYDDRLARRCMDDLKRTARADGMINCCAPTIDVNIIPGFSIYYIMMVHDHMMYFGDKELVKDHLPVIMGIFRFFENNLTKEGYLGKLGGPLYSEYYWSFVDWTIEWNDTLGVPSATNKKTKSLTIESLLYSVGLQKAADICSFIGLSELAEKFKTQAKRINQSINDHCIGENGLYQDGPGVDDYSVHTQVYAILAGACDSLKGKKLLEETVENPIYAQCSVAFSFYLFRALEKVGLYEKTKNLWNLWRRMLKNNLTTCVENGTDERSDCHAWGALLLYELPATILGVRPAAAGYEKVSIKPVPGYLDYASGDCITRKGLVHVEWKRNEKGELSINKTLPDGLIEI